MDDGAAWRGENFGLATSITVFGGVINGLQGIIDACDSLPEAFGAKALCQLPVLAARVAFELLVLALEIALGVSENLYGEQATPSDQVGETEFQKGRQDAIYENVITNHGNIIATFKGTEQLKVMLGGVLEDEDNVLRRRLQSNSCEFDEIDPDCTCVLTRNSGYISGCTKPSCEDPTRLCDGTPCTYTEGSIPAIPDGCTCVSTKDDGFQRGCDIPSCENTKRLCNGAFNYKSIADLRQGEFLMIYTSFGKCCHVVKLT